MSYEPDLNDPAQRFAKAAMDGIQASFDPERDQQWPRFVVVIELPPGNRIGIASTGDSDVDTHRLLSLGAASTRNAMSPADRRRARRLWDTMRAGFERRN